jgi:hypothetical protein
MNPKCYKSAILLKRGKIFQPDGEVINLSVSVRVQQQSQLTKSPSVIALFNTTKLIYS